MKKLFIILLGVGAFACGNTDNTQNEANRDGAAIDESVEIGSGDEINPQLEFETDSQQVFEVDTISSAADANQRQQ